MHLKKLSGKSLLLRPHFICLALLIVCATSAAFARFNNSARHDSSPTDSAPSITVTSKEAAKFSEPGSSSIGKFSPGTAIPSSALQDKEAEKPIDVVLVMVTPTGFDQAEVKRSKGKFLLALENISELDDLNFQLTSDRGNKEKEKRMKKERISWNDVLDLHPGDYTLTEDSHPEWKCRFTITPN